MSETPNILLLAPPDLAGRLAAALPTGGVTEQTDPFAALEALSHRAYQTVLVAVPQPDLPELLGAIRRLQPDCRLFGLCTPVGEYELRRSEIDRDRLMEDYFIIPPTAGEWRYMLEDDKPEEPVATLTPRQISDLIEAIGSTDDLCECVGPMVASMCDAEIHWSRQGERAGVQRICQIEANPPRILWAAEPMDPDERQTLWLSALRTQLPSLAAAAMRSDTLTRLAMTDHLTGVYNRRYFMSEAAKRLDVAKRKLLPATLMIYDIDDFKLYNDTYGHITGDRILREIAVLMEQTTRKHDLVARVGGDEFAVLFCDFGPSRKPGSKPPTTAYDLATRFRKAVNSHEFEALGPGAAGTLTISGGLATFPWNGDDVDALMAAADEALLAAKAGGKNTIYLIGDNAPE